MRRLSTSQHPSPLIANFALNFDAKFPNDKISKNSSQDDALSDSSNFQDPCLFSRVHVTLTSLIIGHLLLLRLYD